jgi:hypothetical protein
MCWVILGKSLNFLDLSFFIYKRRRLVVYFGTNILRFYDANLRVKQGL